MESSEIPFLNWPPSSSSSCFLQDKTAEEFALLAMELHEVKTRSEEEIHFRDREISRLNQLLSEAVGERDEALENCRRMTAENALLHRRIRRSYEDDAAPDSDDSIVSSPPAAADRPLPEKGKLLEAVMKAGPLLQTLLLAGPLPQWRHPPPPLDPYQIPPPPVIVRKRALSDGSDESAAEFKLAKVVLR